MDNIGSIVFLALFALGGAVYGYCCAESGKPAHLGRYGLIVLLVLVAGLLLAGLVGSDTLGWLFGLSLMATLPLFLILGIASALGRFVYRARAKERR